MAKKEKELSNTEKEVAYKKQILPKTWLKKGNRLFKLGRHKEALKAFNQTIALDPNNGIGYYRKGNSLEKLDQYDSAYAAYLKAQNIDPNNKTLHHHMGICLLKLEKFKQAYETFKKALQYYPCDLMILEHLRFALREVKDKKDEEELQDRMEEMISNEATPWQDKVNKLIEYKFFTEVKQILDEIIEQRELELKLPRLNIGSRKALESMKNHWTGLTVFVDHPHIPMSNAEAERMMRNPALGRKNYYGSGSEWSAEYTAMMFSIFQTIKKHRMNEKKWLLCYLTACAANKGKAPPDISRFLPWNMSEKKKEEYG